jgi:negative regulator of sigma E activity
VSEIDPQEFGRLQAQVETLIASDATKTALLQALAEDMQAVRLQLAEARGGWRLLVGLGGAAASVGAAIAWAAQHLRVGQ